MMDQNSSIESTFSGRYASTPGTGRQKRSSTLKMFVEVLLLSTLAETREASNQIYFTLSRIQRIEGDPENPDLIGSNPRQLD